VFGAQPASQLLAAVTGVFMVLNLNRYRTVVVTSQRVLILDASSESMKTARSLVRPDHRLSAGTRWGTRW
jgi:hypothetical protein